MKKDDDRKEAPRKSEPRHKKPNLEVKPICEGNYPFVDEFGKREEPCAYKDLPGREC